MPGLICAVPGQRNEILLMLDEGALVLGTVAASRLLCLPLVLSHDDQEPTIPPAVLSNPTLPSSRPLLTRTIPTVCDSTNQDTVITPHGTVRVDKGGNTKGPAIITFHDLGLAGPSNFQVAIN